MPTSASWDWRSPASFSVVGTPWGRVNLRLSFWPSFSRIPSAPTVQPASSRSFLAASGS